MRLWLILPCLVAMPAQAAEVFGGLAAHDVNLFGLSQIREPGVDLVVGVRSGPVARLGKATLHGQLLGSTSLGDGLGFAAAGVVVRVPVGRNFYVQPGVGIAVHTGNGQNFQATPDALYLGSRVVFEPELVAGVRLAPRWAAEIAYVHLSHANLFGRQNPGLDTVGVRLSYHFGR